MDTSIRITVSNDQSNQRNVNVNGRGWRGGGGGWRGGGGRGRGRYNNNNNNNNWQHRGDMKSPNEVKKKGGMVARKDPLSDLPKEVLNIRVILTRLGDFTQMSEDDQKELDNNIKGFAAIFVEQGDLYEFPSDLSALFVSCLSSLSIQVPILVSIIAAIYGLEISQSETIAEDKILFGDLVVLAVRDKFLSTLTDRRLGSCKLLLRSLCCLSLTGCISIQTFENVLEALLKKADMGDIQIVWLVASTIPWMCLSDSLSPSILNHLRSCLTVFLDRWREDSPFRFQNGSRAVLLRNPPMDGGEGEGDENDCTPDSLSELCRSSLQMLDSHGQGQQTVVSSCLCVPWKSWDKEDLPNGTTMKRFVDLGDMNLSLETALSSSSSSSSSDIEEVSSALLQIFDSESSPEASLCYSTMTSMDRLLAREFISDLLLFFDPIVNDDGTQLGSIDLLTAHLLAMEKLFPKEAHLEYVLVETLLQKILQVSTHHLSSSSSSLNPPSASIYKLLLTLCKRQPVFAPVLALAVNIVFQLVPDLNPIVWRGFANWFSFHLVNTQLVWPYWQFWLEEWSEVSVDKDFSEVRLFLQAISDKVQRSAIADKVKAVFPEEVVKLSKLSEDLVATLTEEDDWRYLKVLLMDKADPDDVEEWIRGNSSSSSSSSSSGVMLFKALISVGLGQGALSGLLGLVDRYSEVLRSCCNDDGESCSSEELIQVLFSVFGRVDMGNFDFLLDEMLRRGLVSVTAAAQWLSGEFARGLQSEHWIFSIAETVVDRTLDFVKAAVAVRVPLGGQLAMGRDMDLVASESSSLKKASAVTEGNQEAVSGGKDLEEVDYDDDDEEEDNNNRRRVRSRREEEEKKGDDDEKMEEGGEGEEDPVLVATEVVKNAIRSSRGVFREMVSNLGQIIDSDIIEEEKKGIDLCIVMSTALLQRTLRSFMNTEESLSRLYHQSIVLSDRSVLSEASARVKDISQRIYKEE